MNKIHGSVKVYVNRRDGKKMKLERSTAQAVSNDYEVPEKEAIALTGATL